MICCGERRRRRTEVAPVLSVPCRVSCRVMTSAPRGKRARSFVQLDEIGQIIIIKSSTNNDAAQVQARSLAHSRRCTLAEREREGKVRTGRPRSHRGNRCWKNVRRSWKEPAGKKRKGTNYNCPILHRDSGESHAAASTEKRTKCQRIMVMVGHKSCGRSRPLPLDAGWLQLPRGPQRRLCFFTAFERHPSLMSLPAGWRARRRPDLISAPFRRHRKSHWACICCGSEMTSNARPQAADETALFQGRDSCSCSPSNAQASTSLEK